VCSSDLLIVEFAVIKRHEGLSLVESALEVSPTLMKFLP